MSTGSNNYSQLSKSRAEIAYEKNKKIFEMI